MPEIRPTATQVDAARGRGMQAWDDRVAPVMFVVAMISLAGVAVTLHVGNGVDLLVSLTLSSVEPPEHVGWEVICVGVVGLSYVMMWLETVFWWLIGSPRWRRHTACCVFPPLRIATRDHSDGSSVWLPVRGWVRVDGALRDRLERRFSIPMISVALLVLPLFVFEQFWADEIEASTRLTLAASLAASLIWFAFAFEFSLMISVVEKRVQYCKKHWIDIVVILAPMVAFLRMVQVSRMLRLKQLTKTARVYRMRGVLMRTYRAVMLLDLVQRIVWGGPERRLRKLQAMLTEKRDEVAQLEQAIAELTQRLEAVEMDDRSFEQAL